MVLANPGMATHRRALKSPRNEYFTRFPLEVMTHRSLAYTAPFIWVDLVIADFAEDALPDLMVDPRHSAKGSSYLSLHVCRHGFPIENGVYIAYDAASQVVCVWFMHFA